MRLMLATLALLLISVSVLAQDARPATPEELQRRLAELEAEAKRLSEEIARLRADLDALNKSPAVLWQLDMSSDLKGSGAVADVDGDGRLDVVFGSYYHDENVYCVEAATGKLKWKFKSHGGPLDASVAIDDLDGDGKPEILAADSAFGKLYKLNGRGELLGTIALPSGTDSPPAVADLDGDGTKEIVIGTMWAGGKNRGWVCCYDGKSLQQKWKRELAGCIQSEPCLVDVNGDKVLDAVVTSWRGDRRVTALNGTDGSPLWFFETAGNDKSMGMYHGVALGGGDKPFLYIATTEGDVYALGLDGKQQWKQTLGQYLFAPITVADADNDGAEELYLGGSTLFALAAKDGTTLWKQQLKGSLDRGVALADADGDGKPDLIFNDHKALVAHDTKTGRQTLRVELGFGTGQWEAISSAPIIADFDGDGLLEVFVVCGVGTSENEGKANYGRAYAVKLKGKGPAWKTLRGNLRRTGNDSGRD